MTESPIRRALLWWFGWPENPWVTINLAIDFAPARRYLATLPGVTVNHLVAAAIGRTLARFPEANAYVVGRRIVRAEHVGIGMPVNLLGHSGEARSELGMAIVERVDTLTLREVAAATRRTVASEREGKSANVVVKGMLKLLTSAPQRVVNGSLTLLDRATRRRAVSDRVHRLVPITTALSNAGAAIADTPGMLFRGADVALPKRLVQIGTFWGLAAVQEEVVAIDGVATVRPMLPLLFLFDHRLIDGVKAARMMAHFGAILQDPAAEFGPTGDRPAPLPISDTDI